jgi:hypothetical protein
MSVKRRHSRLNMASLPAAGFCSICAARMGAGWSGLMASQAAVLRNIGLPSRAPSSVAG